MSWLFSRALVAEYLAGTCSVGKQSAPSSANPTPQVFCAPDRMTAFSRLSRFGLTCAPLTESLGEDLLMSFLVAFPARTSAPPERAPASMASDPGYGEKWRELSVRYDRGSFSWRTVHSSSNEVLPWSSVTLPTWGMTRNGSVCRHPTLERPISGIGLGLWQTIVADDSADRAKGKWNSRGEPKLSAQVLHPEHWPTPTVCGNYNRKGASATSGDGLATIVQQRTWPTATATAYKGWSPNHNRADTNDRLDYTVERESFQPGQQTPPMRLNPDWAEWLMGWPIGHTALKPLEMGKFREWQQQHSPFSRGN